MAVAAAEMSRLVPAGHVKPRIEEEEEDDEDEFVNPLLQLLFDFCTEPRSSTFAYYWGVFLAWLVLVNLLAVGLASCDGPNQYEGRKNESSYWFLLSKNGYWTVTLVTQIPLVLDAIGRTVLLFCIFAFQESKRLLESLRKDLFVLLLLCCDIIGVFPFFVYSTKQTLSSNATFFLSLTQLLSTGRILRITKDIPAVWAIRIALFRSMEHLVLPFFVFFIFNITVAVIIFFVEPCYNRASCPWHDLFEASFYSVVSMTTTGYGNQTPQFALLRLFACLVMVFGAVFMSMPLAIIGNEYSEAWDEVIGKLRDEHKKRLETASKRLKELFKSSIRLMPVAAVNAAVHKMKNEFIREHGEEDDNIINSELDDQMQQQQQLQQQQHRSGSHANALNPSDGIIDRMKVAELMTEKLQQDYNSLLQRSAMLQAHRKAIPLLAKLESEMSKCTRLSPLALMYITELRGWLIALKSGSTFVIDQLTKDMLKPDQQHAKPKRLSMIGIGVNPTAPNPIDAINKAIAANREQSTSGNINSDSDNEEEIEENPTALQMVTNLIFGTKSNQHETEHSIMLAKLKKDPTNFRLRLWQALEIHNSSREARFIQIVSLVLILLSVLLLYTETLSSWNNWGPRSSLCGSVLHKYCDDKHSNVLDPGCYVHDEFGAVTDQRLRYFCEDSDCFGYGTNFGSMTTNLTCADDPVLQSYPFQSQNELTYTYGRPIMFTSRPMMHRLSAVCLRMECNPLDTQSVDGPSLFFKCEVVITLIFTLEVLLRIAVADSIMRYFSSAMNIFDLCSIFPFFVEVSGLDNSGGNNKIDFGIIASSPENYFLVLARSFKIFRLYKLVRFFKASKVFTDTARKCSNQLLGILTLMLCLVILFAIMLYQVEKGRSCFVGEFGCDPPEAVAAIVHDGDRIMLNKNGDLSQFPDVFYGLWFSFVTLTTTGYGDIVPVTNTGQIMTVFLMLAGSCYLSMPLTVASSTFYEVHEQFLKKRQTKNQIEQQAAEAQVFAAKAAKDNAWKRRLQQLRTAVTMSIQSIDIFLSDLQGPSTAEQQQQHNRQNNSNYSSNNEADSASNRSPKLKSRKPNAANAKSSLLQRAVAIVNESKTTMSTIGRDLEALALTSTMLYNKQPKEGKNHNPEKSTLIVC